MNAADSRRLAGEPVPCPLCGCLEGKTVHAESWITVRRCAACRFLFTLERSGDFRDDRLGLEIEEFYRWLDASRGQRAPLLTERLEQIAHDFGLGPELSVLEVGTGAGALAQACATLGHRYTGLEPFLGERFEQTALADAPGIAIHPIRLEDYRPRERFHVAVMDNVLEHLADPVGAVRKLLDLLHPGGVLWAQVPNEANLVLKHKLLSRLKERRITFPGHVNLFTAQSLARCLRTGGAANVEIRSTSASHPVLTRLLLMREPGPVLGAVMSFLRVTRLDIHLGRAYWLDAYGQPEPREGS